MFGITRAPEINRPGLVWLNTPKPLSLAELKGRVVILDFWTFCCINCIQVLPSLRRIEEAFGDRVAVIGVHSPKFAAERKAGNVAEAVARYGIRHPVIHDPYMSLWQDYAVRAWPTLVFLSPDGQVVGQVSGEPNPEALLEGIGHMLAEFEKEGRITPGPAFLQDPPARTGSLRYPGKIKPCPGGLWAVADGGHHQIALFDDKGQEVARFGSGQEGLLDGDAAHARFASPQGLACDDKAIWVADTGNHALRRIDRASGHVTTIAGQGLRGPALRGREQAGHLLLASPWDVELAGGKVYFANAGTHQLAVYDPESDSIALAAGSGGENIIDGLAERALLAQPSGLSLSPNGKQLYFADSETSAIRRLDLDSGEVETLVGTGLFDFGLEDGDFADALLQHPLGLVALEDAVLVADSYNNALRRLDLASRRVETIPWGDCADALCLPLGEPAGIAVAAPNRLLLSDSNNHRILDINLSLNTYCTWRD